MSKKKLILVIEPAFKGDLNNILALAAGVAKKTPNSQIVVLKNLSSFKRKGLGLAFKFGLKISFLCRYVNAGLDNNDQCPVIVISTLGGSELYSALLAKKFNIPNIHLVKIKRLPQTLFSMSIAHQGVKPTDQQVEMPTPFTRFFKDDLQKAAGNLEKPVGASYALLLLGGDAPKIHYRSSDWDKIFLFLEKFSHHTDIKWLISTSPRTPDAAIEKVKQLSRKSDAVQEISIYKGGEGDISKLPVYIANSDYAFITGESISMISDALALGLSTVALAVKGLEENETINTFLEAQKAQQNFKKAFIDDLSQDISLPVTDTEKECWTEGFWKLLKAERINLD